MYALVFSIITSRKVNEAVKIHRVADKDVKLFIALYNSEKARGYVFSR